MLDSKTCCTWSKWFMNKMKGLKKWKWFQRWMINCTMLCRQVEYRYSFLKHMCPVEFFTTKSISNTKWFNAISSSCQMWGRKPQAGKHGCSANKADWNDLWGEWCIRLSLWGLKDTHNVFPVCLFKRKLHREVGVNLLVQVVPVWDQVCWIVKQWDRNTPITTM